MKNDELSNGASNIDALRLRQELASGGVSHEVKNSVGISSIFKGSWPYHYAQVQIRLRPLWIWHGGVTKLRSNRANGPGITYNRDDL